MASATARFSFWAAPLPAPLLELVVGRNEDGDELGVEHGATVRDDIQVGGEDLRVGSRGRAVVADLDGEEKVGARGDVGEAVGGAVAVVVGERRDASAEAGARVG
jgi:hypothetical protein